MPGNHEAEFRIIPEPKLPPAPDMSELPEPVRQLAEDRINSLTRNVDDVDLINALRGAVSRDIYRQYNAAQKRKNDHNS